MHLVARQSVARAEPANSRQHLILKAATTVEIRFGCPDVRQELADQGTHRRALFGGPDASATVDVRR